MIFMTAKEAKILAESIRNNTSVDSEFNRIIELITEACNKGHLGITLQINKPVDLYVIERLTKLGYNVSKSRHVSSVFSIFWSNES